MAMKIAINGFGRIGRVVFRQIHKAPDFEVIGINDLTPVPTSVHLLKYDSVHGRLDAKVEETENGIRVDGRDIPVYSTIDVDEVAQNFKEADFVFECTGKVVGKAKLQKFIDAGVKFVILSRPRKEEDEVDGTYVLGVNHQDLNPEVHKIVSNASCTTNCLAPLANILHKKYGIINGLMTTTHAYTNDQNTLDQGHKDLRRARAANLSMIPTTTGAARAVGKVIPDLNGKLDGFAIRVPTPNVSVVDLCANLEKETTAEEINAAVKEAADGDLAGILEYSDEPLVSMDYNGSNYSSNFDALSTRVMGGKGTFIKVLSWYDNETGYSTRMVDLARYMMTGSYK